MKAAQNKILDIVKDKDDSTYLFTEARRQLSQVSRGRLGQEALPEFVRRLPGAGNAPDWYELWLVSARARGFCQQSGGGPGQLRRKRKRLAAPTASVAQHIRLLSLVGRYQEAADLLERIPEQLRQPLLENFYTEILFRTNKVDDAIRQARTAAEAAPKDVKKQFWHGQLLTRSTQMPDLTDEQRKARTTDAIAACAARWNWSRSFRTPGSHLYH